MKDRSPKSLTVDLFPSRESRTFYYFITRDIVLRTPIVAQREEGEGTINFYNQNRCQTISRYRTYACNMNAIRGFGYIRESLIFESGVIIRPVRYETPEKIRRQFDLRSVS